MPIYEYVCSDCSQHFEALVRSNRSAVCPQCKSSNLQKQLSVFAANTKSGGEAPQALGPSPCMTCGDPRGPGSCSIN